jgi:hypothetical protein
MKRKSISFWIRVIISVVIGLACFLALQQSAQAGSSQPAPVFASPIPGNIMIYRMGDGSAALNANATAVFVDEYTTGGTLVQSIPMPTAVSGGQRRLTASGSATSEGFLTLSDDRQYIMLTGYDAAVGTAAIVGSTSVSVNRVVGRVDIFGNFDTSTALTDFASGSNPRSAASTDGNSIWVSGNSTGASGGVRYTTLGSTTSTGLVTGFTNGRQVKIGRGQLYISSASGANVGVNTVGVGTPTTGGQSIALLPGLPGTGGPNSFYLADLDAGVAGFDTVYVADDGGTIQKYSLVVGSWTANGTVALAGARGLTGIHNGSTVTLYATSTSTLSRLIDASGYNATITGAPATLATAATNTAFRGVAFAPGTSPTAVQVANLSAHPTDSTPLFLVIALGLVGMVSVWFILRRRSRAA